MRKFSKMLCVVFSLMFMFVALAGCDSTSTESDNTQKLSYVSMRINPEIELVVDENNLVVAANAINEDGDATNISVYISTNGDDKDFENNLIEDIENLKDKNYNNFSPDKE